jgi:hypothetical protein
MPYEQMKKLKIEFKLRRVVYFTNVILKMAVFWDVVPRSLVDNDDISEVITAGDRKFL